MQKCYEAARLAGADPTSEFYRDGRPRTGASHRVGYWQGRSGTTNGLYARMGRDTLGYAFYTAGVDDRKDDIRKGNLCPKPNMAAMGGPIYPKWTPTPNE